MSCPDCGKITECDSPQTNYVRIGYVENEPTTIGVYSSWGDSKVDILPLIQKGETNTHLDLNKKDRTLDYYQELWISSNGHKGCINEICLTDVFALMHLNEIGDVNIPNPHTGETIIYNETTGKWEAYDLAGNITNLQNQINNLDGRVKKLVEDFNNAQTQIQKRFTTIENRISDIENIIYNYPSDKTTKIPRGNINIFSGDWGGNAYIRSRDWTNNDENNDDLRFS